MKRLAICYKYIDAVDNQKATPFIEDVSHRIYYGKHAVTQDILLDVLYRWGYDGSTDIDISASPC